jgi:PPOX class probable F420-dependent enzyme
VTADLNLVQELASADDFLGVVGVARPDGSVHASLVKAGVLPEPLDGEPSVGMVVTGNARKLHHLRRVGRATVVFKDGWRWASVEGAVTLLGPDDHLAKADLDLPQVVREVYKAAGGTHDDWDEFDRIMAEDRRCAVFVRTDEIRGSG